MIGRNKQDHRNETRQLITGALGYVGSLFTRLGGDNSCLTVDRQPGAHSQSCISALSAGFLRDERIDAVIHLADSRLEELNGENLGQNLDRHKAFIECLAGCPAIKRIIFASSCSVYGKNETPINEDSPLNPTSHYAESKLRTEELIRGSGLPFLILRFGTAFGLSPQMRDDLFVNQLVKAFSRGEELCLYSPNARRPYIHCTDFSRSLRHALTLNPGQTGNVVAANYTKWQLLEEYKAATAQEPRVVLNGKDDPRDYYVSGGRAKALGFRAEIPMREGIAEMAAHYA